LKYRVLTMDCFINGLKALCQLVPANTLEKRKNFRKLSRCRKILLDTGHSDNLNYPLYLYFIDITYLYKDTLTVIIVLFLLFFNR